MARYKITLGKSLKTLENFIEIICKYIKFVESGIKMKEMSMKPYHLFNYRGFSYLINVEKMSASILNDSTSLALEKYSKDSTLPMDNNLKKELEELDLLSSNELIIKDIQNEQSQIVTMCLFLTQSCNLKCIYCYGDGGGYGTGGDMEERTAFQSVDWLFEKSGNAKVLRLGFFGGEPFLKFQLMKSVIQYTKTSAKEAGKTVLFSVTTNATLLDEEKISFIKKHQISVMVSFDGSKEIQDLQRPYANGVGSYEIIVPKIKKLLEVLPNTPGHAVIMGDTDPVLVKNSLKEIGFTNVSIALASRSLFDVENILSNISRNTPNLLKGLEQEAETWYQLIKSKDIESLRLMARRGLYQGLIALLNNRQKYHFCGAGLRLVAISSSGDIYLCHRFVGQDDYKLGNILEKDLNWKDYQKNTTKVNTICNTCFAKYYCAGGCKYDNASSGGTVFDPPPDMCWIRRRELELAATITCKLGPNDKEFLYENNIIPIPPRLCPLDF